MSTSYKYLCVADETIFEIPKTRIRENIIKKELAKESVLKLTLCYDIKDRRPNKILEIHFDRKTFDGSGVCNFRADLEDRKRMYDYIFDEKYPLPIPKAPVIPDKTEIVRLKQFLTSKYPSLLKNDPYAIELAIIVSKEQYQQQVRKFKQSHHPAN